MDMPHADTTIPVLTIPAATEQAVASAMAEPARLALLIQSAHRTYTPLGVRFADGRSRGWATRSTSPYAAAVAAVEQVMGQPGAYLLNHSYEWGCTTGAAADPAVGGMTLLRTLDWPFHGLGRALIVTRQHPDAGPYLSVTWPGMVGVLTGLAPGRFAAAINQPPLPWPAWGKAVGWLGARWRVSRSRALPPSHLLRLAFETCRTFADAVALIRRTPVCIPAIITIAGPNAGEAATIERTEDAAFQPAEAIAANHWTALAGPAGHPRHPSSHGRHAAMCGLAGSAPAWSFAWLQPPILQADTRVAVMANPRTGRLMVQGWEATGPATAVLDMA